MSDSTIPVQWLRFVEAANEIDRLLEIAPTQTTEERLALLMRALDTLAIAFQDLSLPAVADASIDVPSTRDKRAEQIKSAFPELGYYWSVRPEWSETAGEPTLGDAFDDLLDIIHDVDEALWYADNRFWQEGMWHARFTWEHHAGAHLVDLRSYIYRLRWFGY